MHTWIMKRAVVGALGAAAMLMTGAAQATLQDRDLNGDTVTDAFYDTDLNITWLRDVNGPGGNWYQAVANAAAFSFDAYSDWRLPNSEFCAGDHCVGSEMGHLWFVELGNSVGQPSNTGGFQNLLVYDGVNNAGYWSGTEIGASAFQYVYYSGGNGLQFTQHKEAAGLSTMYVRDGDVSAPAIPEPETYALMLIGLTALALARRQQGR